MGVNSLHKTVSRQRRDCDLNSGSSAPESSTLTTRLPSHPTLDIDKDIIELLRIRRLTYFGHVSRMPAEMISDFHPLHCLDVLGDLVQEEDRERNGWAMSKKIVRLRT